MQIFRRSNLPWADHKSHPERAPNDAEVRDWMKRDTLPKPLTEPLARLIEKALARKPETLDLSSVHYRALESLKVSLLVRLRGPTRVLVLDERTCPPQLAARLMLETGARRIEPQSLMDTVEEKWRPHQRRPLPPIPTDPSAAGVGAKAAPPRHGPIGAVPQPREENVYEALPGLQADPIYDVPPRREVASIYDVPPRREAAPTYDVLPRRPSESIYDVPPRRDELFARRPRTGLARQIDMPPSPSAPRVSQQDLEAADTVMRTLHAWQRAHAGNEGQHPRCAMSSQNADALARALLDTPTRLLKPHERTSLHRASAVLAARQPGRLLQLDPETVRHFGVAMQAVQGLATDRAR
ncbi:hypothetical protein [Mitsuaria sp. GD03876]|uniref:hypothetical protein n=1 Tax=Mitsuaria sp. GD03876 TaxID=2975399 RepID=UPI0024478093|nr:hypothetical protein [Mitsuaria sp. GD03876]MDH0865218.1 hypothetical protein [Mitsuaria sp. GD03876]